MKNIVDLPPADGSLELIREQWDGGEWQQHCCSLLGMKYKEDIQFIPDRMRGDGGLEAYRLDDTIVYQCYAPKDCFSIETQTNAQKSKIRKDIGKLVNKPAETVDLVGRGYLIRRWVLLTPEYDDKEIVKYARAKSFTVRSDPRPPWCHETFEIVVSSDRDLFAKEIAVLYDAAPGVIRIHVDDRDAKDVSELVLPGISETLTNKLQVNPAFAADREYLSAYRDETLRDYVHGKSLIEKLQDKYPLASEAIIRRAQITYQRLTRRLAPGNNQADDIRKLTDELAEAFARDVPALDSLTCEQLAQYYVATWWVSCPIRFRATA